MKKIACFGELLLRLSPAASGEWLQRQHMDVYPGGAELNVATALASWNNDVEYLTALPENYLSHDLLQYMQSRNVGHGRIFFHEGRIGTYYLQQGADLKHAGVIYDRAGSSFARLKTGTINWHALLDGVEWLHLTAISPALSAETASLCNELVSAAAARNIFISLDLNYRSRLWQYGKEPAEVMPELVRQANLVMGNLWAANKMLNTPLEEDLLAGDEEALCRHAALTAAAIRQQFPRCETVAFTFRFDEGEGIRYFGTLHNGQHLRSRTHRLEKVTDRAGSGDCFMAGLIHGLVRRWTPQQTIDFAAAAAVGKLLEKGDATSQTEETIKQRTG